VQRKDRSSFRTNWCPADEKESIIVECVRLDEIFEEFGIPYYLKIDIEHHDHVCIEALARQTVFPQFVSVETDGILFIRRTSLLGYSKFKVISQVWNQDLSLPMPPKEGVYVNQRFTEYHSGPFGEEPYGEWLSKDEALDEISTIIDRDYDNSRHKSLGCPEERFLESWFDVHAALS
jgi:hypothetical protein